ncbi:hypothetical protein BFW01_g10788 [Lasiodiplodia theobromae]|uniref:Uncharacterized protein n=1 Tax=Lasiodiplodia theobromae TaxID=45133 RepID=A0A5N5DTR3_9PEZI|nr:hypothetical protein DBV05_g145 [Lasiodiplodia theobromae]KAF9629585.1 hypothetical protein BFW01_g10788 [Lasiodiplodia theobromae]
MSSDHVPSPNDVYAVRNILRSLKLPPELVLSILAFARYNPRVHAARHENRSYRASSMPNHCVAGLYLCTPVIPVPHPSEGYDDFKIAAVTFALRSADQGWGGDRGHGLYRGSWTWFEASILRRAAGVPEDGPVGDGIEHGMSHRLSEPAAARELLNALGWDFAKSEDGKVAWTVQCNRVAHRAPVDHEVCWRRHECRAKPEGDDDGKGDGAGFLELMRPGDRVALWGRAQFPSWVNNVESAEITVDYEV